MSAATTQESIHATSISAASKLPISELLTDDRDRRRGLIEEIEEITDRRLICYVTRNGHIDDNDVRYVWELLHNLKLGTAVDLLINSPGGDANTAEKLVYMIRQVTCPPPSTDEGEGKFQLIVPERAKSAATLIALSANKIIMSDTSELGPIDPQVLLPDQFGNLGWYSVFDYIDAYKKAENNYRENPQDPVCKTIFKKFDPTRLQQLEQMKTRIRVCAENLLKRHGGNWSMQVDKLMDTKLFHSHGQMISWEIAKNEIELNVEYMESRTSLWLLYWRLYCHLRLAITDNQKIFETSQVSLIV